IYLEITAENALDGVFANEPIYFGLLASAIVFIVVSLSSKPTPDDVWRAWQQRSKHGVDDTPQQADTAAERIISFARSERHSSLRQGCQCISAEHVSLRPSLRIATLVSSPSSALR